jgi:hypothetical protein
MKSRVLRFRDRLSLEAEIRKAKARATKMEWALDDQYETIRRLEKKLGYSFWSSPDVEPGGPIKENDHAND